MNRMLNLTVGSTHVKVKFRFLTDEPYREALLLQKAWVRHLDIKDRTKLVSIRLDLVGSSIKLKLHTLRLCWPV